MSAGAGVVVLLDAALMGALPRIFFRRDGRFNLRWWLTALPFFAASGAVLLAALGLVVPLRLSGKSALMLDLAAAGLSTASIGLMCFTLGTHRIPIALWHQSPDDDAPRQIVTWGAYGRIRHPFYASFLLLLTACLLICPHAVTAVAFLWGAAVLDRTAALEEARLARSEFGPEYEAYKKRTGRFFPRLS